MGCLDSRAGKERRTCNYVSEIWIPPPRDLLHLMLAWTTKYQGSFRFSGAKIWNTHSCMWDTQTEEYQPSRLVLLLIKHMAAWKIQPFELNLLDFVASCKPEWQDHKFCHAISAHKLPHWNKLLICPWGEWVRWCVMANSYGTVVSFFRYDVNNDHYLDLMEMKQMMEKLGAPQTHVGLKAMIAEIDEDNDGKVSFREVIR